MDPQRWRRVHALLQDAIALAPAERPAFLDRACESPEDRQEVESLLAHHRDDDGFLEGGPGPLAANLMTDHYEPGAQLGPYRIVRELGRGGMGVVYLGHDTRLDRDVAIKMLPAGAGADASRRARLRREARAAAAVTHPGVARIYAFEEDAEGAGFLVSEYVVGHTLREEIRRGPLPPAVAVETARQVAVAVAAAHDRGVVHRDLKPENVMRADDGTIKVLDFGLAHLAVSDLDETHARLTAAGTVLGTPAYMSPEQLRGTAAGPETDVFALGVVLYEMLTGEHPFDGDHTSATGIMVRILESAPRALPSSVVASVPGVAAVVGRCLSKEAAARFHSMRELAAALGAVEDGSGFPDSAVASGRTSAVPVSRDTWWWQFHQVTMSVLYVAMIYPVWRLRGAPLPPWAHSPLLLGLIGAAAVATTVRMHWIFTARMHPELLHGARRRARTWIRIADAGMVILLLAAAGAALVRDTLWLAAIFATVAASAAAASLLIEPSTTEAAFGRDER